VAGGESNAEILSRFDVADYLTTEPDIDAYLEAASNDPDSLDVALATIARSRALSQVSRNAKLK
jgi:probable addiction module antidote protein